MEDIIITDGRRFALVKKGETNGIALRSAKTVVAYNGLLQLVYTGKKENDTKKITSLVNSHEDAKDLFNYIIK
jgi:hypothetical protein